MIDRSFLGPKYKKRITNTCFNCRREIIHISKIHIKGNDYVYHCENCKEAAEEEAKFRRELHGIKSDK